MFAHGTALFNPKFDDSITARGTFMTIEKVIGKAFPIEPPLLLLFPAASPC